MPYINNPWPLRYNNTLQPFNRTEQIIKNFYNIEINIENEA
jgi:hypothetical protein